LLPSLFASTLGFSLLRLCDVVFVFPFVSCVSVWTDAGP
jgi:hypothetical protein